MTLLEDLIRAIELWLRIAKEQVPLVDPTLDPVLLVPGIAGSILEAVDEEGNKERVCYSNGAGKTVSVNEKTRITVPEDRYGLYAIDTLDPDLATVVVHPEKEGRRHVEVRAVGVSHGG
ncbi:unnamed protein product [Miscanthus lutarioriparius]|uniref:Uncharacterized protein n=1 Tax=Miscanthus lutarioriparius TaxID=422564 RepID=A0A811PSH3_9POAL|nr:unnamed protein product [Miscanthus lutarioriparius]